MTLVELTIVGLNEYLKDNNVPRDPHNSSYASVYSEIRKRLTQEGSNIEQFDCCLSKETYLALIDLLPDEEQKNERIIFDNLS